MNKFVFVACIGILVSLAAARPDLSLGYRYNQGHSSGGGHFLNAPASSSSVSSSYSPTASGSSYFSAAPAIGQVGIVPSAQTTYIGGGGSSLGGFNGYAGGGSSSQGNFIGSSDSGYNTQFISQGSAQTVNYDEQQAFVSHLQNHQAPIVSKHFYIHSAPVDHDEQQIVRYVNVGRPQKNYRVVFIDAPSSTASKAKIIANVAPVEDKTAIYVLSKKSNALDVSAEVVTPAPVNNKPEVFFIKYKTPEEAIHAQHTIQAQYDTLGGSSDLSNEGTIPVSSVIGSLGDASSGVQTSSSGGSSSGGSSSGGSFSGVSSGSSQGGFGFDANSLKQFEAEQSQNVGSAINVIQTGDNTQQTYLPSHHKF